MILLIIFIVNSVVNSVVKTDELQFSVDCDDYGLQTIYIVRLIGIRTLSIAGVDAGSIPAQWLSSSVLTILYLTFAK